MFASCLMACGTDGISERPIVTPSDPGKEDPSGQETPKPDASVRTEQFRPQVHFTPAKNWMNDPNGMVYIDGVWHLFYQYNPYGNGWGNMSWGHATSSDLMHWEEQPVALEKNDLGDIFSGSCVIDKENTAGFGSNAMVAFYTSAGKNQQQSMAYSTDGGKKFTQYASNPILANSTMPDFRDPKVFWHKESGKWIMSLARGWTYAIDFYSSKDLKSWQFMSSFSTEAVRCNRGQWECPDLIQIDGKWVLIVSVNPGGPTAGSGTMYFTGDFDGTNFTADKRDYPLWLDYGMDNYAGVTWSNTPDNRHVFIGWMNNWNYSGDVPCSPWRSAMTLPRELGIKTVNGLAYVTAPVVKEIDKIAGPWKNSVSELTFDNKSAWQARITVDLDKNHTINLVSNNGKDKVKTFAIDVNKAARCLIAQRNGECGRIDFNGQFSLPGVTGQFFTPDGAKTITLDIYVDQCSVEIVSEDGVISMTNLVFPASIYNSINIDGKTDNIQVRQLNRIW